MKKGNWIPIDKRFVNSLPTDRQYTILEAMFSYTFDRDKGITGSISGYSALWKWDRKTARRFIRAIENGGEFSGTPRGTGTGQAVRYVFNDLQSTEGQERDRQRDTTIYPNPNPKNKNKGIYPEADKSRPLSFFEYAKQISLSGEKIEEDAYYATVDFLDQYKLHRGEDHPNLRPEQWAEVTANILVYLDEAVDYETASVCIDKYFNTKFQDTCDYRILHYISGCNGESNIRDNRFYEECY